MVGGAELDGSKVGEMLCSACGLSGTMVGVGVDDRLMRGGGGVSDDVTLLASYP